MEQESNPSRRVSGMSIGAAFALAKSYSSPTARIKLLLQAQDAIPAIRSGEVQRYKGIMDCAARIFKEQGLLRFWDGNLFACLSTFPALAVHYAVAGLVKKLLPQIADESCPSSGICLASVLATGASFCACYPLGYVRTRLSSSVGSGQQRFSGPRECVAETIKGPDGFSALYTGFGVSLVGLAAYLGLNLVVSNAVGGLDPDFDPADIASLIHYIAAYPIETVRVRLQLQAERPIEDRLYGGTIDCFKKIVAEEGVKGLYKGFLAGFLVTFDDADLLRLDRFTKNYIPLSERWKKQGAINLG